MLKIGATGDGKSAVATPDGKKPKEEEVDVYGLSQCSLKYDMSNRTLDGMCVHIARPRLEIMKM